MKQSWSFLLVTAFLLVGCDFGKENREAAVAIQKVNVEAAQQCEAKLRGLKRVPIAGTGGKLFLDTERVPNWAVSRDFKLGDECGAKRLASETEVFYWNGKDVIPRSLWLAKGKSLAEIPQDCPVILAQIYFGRLKNCSGIEGECTAKPLDVNSNPPHLHMAPLDNYPLDAYLSPETGTVGLSIRDWKREDGWPRSVSCGYQHSKLHGKTLEEIKRFKHSGLGFTCQIDFYDFIFRGGWSRTDFQADKPESIKGLRAVHKYLNDSIIEEK